MNNNGRKISSKYLLILIFTALFFSVTFNSPANYLSVARFCKILTTTDPAADTTRPRPKAPRAPADTVFPLAKLPPRAAVWDTTGRDTVLRLADSMLAASRVDTPDYVVSKDTMEANIDYKASDSIVMIIPTRNITLYSKAEAKYKDADLTADHIVFDQDRNIVIAHPGVDTAGLPMGMLKIVQTDNTMTADSIIYNIETQ